MARIFYGVLGDSGGHLNRARIVASEMPHHEFLFLGGGRVHELKAEGYAVEDAPMIGTFYQDNKVDLRATIGNALTLLATRHVAIKRIAEIIKSFDPDLIITDYEYFTAKAAHKLGRSCVSLDHPHLVTHCRYAPPREHRISRLIARIPAKILFNEADRFLIVSFFRVPPKNPATTEVLPPVIKQSVLSCQPTEGDHVLVYQTSPTFYRLLGLLERLPHRCIIYGLGERPERKNLVFKAPSMETFLQDLASCRYVIANGGHNAICEALHLGKPVFCFPIANAYEQLLNSYFLAKLGYGSYSTESHPSERILRDFERRLDRFRQRIRREKLLGNAIVTARLEQLVAGKWRLSEGDPISEERQALCPHSIF
jgi:uncharacterized protein (TIGR00661 family)